MVIKENPKSFLYFEFTEYECCKVSSGVYIKIGIAKITDNSATPIHNSFQWKPKSPKIVTKIEDITIPKPTPIKCEVLSDFFPNACILGKIKAVPNIRTKALDKPLINLTTIKNIISSFILIKNVVNIEKTIETKKINLILFVKIDNIEPQRYPKKFHEAIRPPCVLVMFNSSNIKGSIGVYVNLPIPIAKARAAVPVKIKTKTL